jgi:hypothetical protein
MSKDKKRRNENTKDRIYHDGNRWCAICRMITLEIICSECHKRTRAKPRSPSVGSRSEFDDVYYKVVRY